MLSLRYKLAISELSWDPRGDCFCVSDALRDDNVELAGVLVLCCELSRLGVDVDGHSEVFNESRSLSLKARCTSAEVVTSVA